jgi:hypothetical protein
MNSKIYFSAAILAISAISSAHEDYRYRPSWYVGGFVGQSTIVLGSQDIRQGGGLAIAYSRPEPLFSTSRVPGQLVWEAYLDRTYSVNERERSPDTHAFGVLAIARWYSNQDQYGQGFYYGGGWGLQFADRASIDLDSKVNSTPMLEVGTTFPVGRSEILIGLRFLHVSNAGTVGDNNGSNQLFLTVGLRF